MKQGVKRKGGKEGRKKGIHMVEKRTLKEVEQGGRVEQEGEWKGKDILQILPLHTHKQLWHQVNRKFAGL